MYRLMAFAIAAACAGCGVSANGPQMADAPQSAQAKQQDLVGAVRWTRRFGTEVCDSPTSRAPAPDCTVSRNERFTVTGAVASSSLSSAPDAYSVKFESGRTGYINRVNFAATNTDSGHAEVISDLTACHQRNPLKVGMTAEQVLSSCWGRPLAVDAILSTSADQQKWTYEDQTVTVDDGIVKFVQKTR